MPTPEEIRAAVEKALKEKRDADAIFFASAHKKVAEQWDAPSVHLTNVQMGVKPKPADAEEK